MNPWSLAFRRGLRYLSRHEPRSAVASLQSAVDLCPLKDKHTLARILLYLGIALERSGQSALAVKSLVNARRLSRAGVVLKVYQRWVNEYGMRRCSCSEGDDYAAFKSIQVGRYLSKRGNGRFGSRAERDVVYELIRDAWKTIWASKVLLSLRVSEKMAIYRRARIYFPYLYVEDALDSPKEPLRGNFSYTTQGRRTGSPRLGDDDPCFCRSGLPLRKCCGRVSSCADMDSRIRRSV